MHRHEAQQHAQPCPNRHDHGHGQAHAHGDTHAAAAILRAKITGMDCGSCALTIEDGLRKLPGVRRVAVDFTTETLEVEGDVARDAVEHRLRQLGYGLAAAGEPARPQTAPGASGAGALRFFVTQPHQRLAIFAGAACILAAITAREAPAAADSLLRLVLIATVALVGAPIFIKGARALLYSRRVNIDLLMTIAAVGALFIGAAGEGAAVVVLFTLGEGLERYSAARARDSLRSLLAL
ncbi:MAG: cation transporter, partial [Steroidobacteraceae bacterium]